MIRAVVIDDNKDTVNVFAEYLEMLNVRVVSSGYNGRDAVELYKRHTPDVLFLDLSMPEYDGTYGLREIRNIDSKAKVVIITADLNARDSEKLEQLGPTEIFFKPFDMEQIKSLIAKIALEKNSGTLVNNEKKALVSFTITQTLQKISPSATNDIGTRLYAKYGCYFSDCLEHPEYFRDILHETFGNGSAAIIKTIRESLAEFGQQQQISNFLYVISK